MPKPRLDQLGSRLLAEVAQEVGGCPVLTGHTADDLVETVLLHVLRGAGLEGLAGLSPRQVLPVSAFGPLPPRLGRITGEVTIVRPLLDVERWQTAAYCSEHGLSWITDETNDDLALTRNRIRHRLVPLLETYNPSIRRALLRLADLARDDGEVIDRVVEDAWKRKRLTESVLGEISTKQGRRVPARSLEPSPASGGTVPRATRQSFIRADSALLESGGGRSRDSAIERRFEL